jgi:kinesin family protein 3/17
MEEKLIKGGEVISKAALQEAALRKAEKELRERQMQEAALARELAEKEEANLQLEEHFSSLQEEVEVKTKKLKKLWNKFQQAQREVKEQEEEFAVSVRFVACFSFRRSREISKGAVVTTICVDYMRLLVV